jgi:hypothetical protein
MKNSRFLPALMGALAPISTALGASLLVTNPSFEDPAIPAGTFLTTAPPAGWSNYGYIESFAGRDVGVLHPATTSLYTDPAPSGNNVAVVFLLTGGPTESGLQQTLTDALQTGMSYTLNVHVGNIAPDGGPFNFAGFPGYRVDLMAGGQILASDNNSLLPGEGRFLESTVSFTTGATHPLVGQLLGIRLVSLDGPTGIEVNFDNVRLEAQAVAVPEISGTCGWVGLGLGVWAIRRRRAPRRGRPSQAAG